MPLLCLDWLFNLVIVDAYLLSKTMRPGGQKTKKTKNTYVLLSGPSATPRRVPGMVKYE